MRGSLTLRRAQRSRRAHTETPGRSRGFMMEETETERGSRVRGEKIQVTSSTR